MTARSAKPPAAPSTYRLFAGRKGTEIGNVDAQLARGLIQGPDYDRRPPTPRGLIGGVEPAQQLQVILGDHIDFLAVLEHLRKLAAYGNEVGRQVYPYRLGEGATLWSAGTLPKRPEKRASFISPEFWLPTIFTTT
jgi:hypothetical protein